jgi:hypothetical protein
VANPHPERKQGGAEALTTTKAKLQAMPDVVKAKKIKDFAYWIHYDNPDIGLNADILSVKFPESEMKVVEGKFSVEDVSLAGKYEKQQKGNEWETFVFTEKYGMLPKETWQAKVAEGLTTASGSRVIPSDVITYGVSSRLQIQEPNMFTFECPSCRKRLVIQEQPSFCPSCGHKLADTASPDT